MIDVDIGLQGAKKEVFFLIWSRGDKVGEEGGDRNPRVYGGGSLRVDFFSAGAAEEAGVDAALLVSNNGSGRNSRAGGGCSVRSS